VKSNATSAEAPLILIVEDNTEFATVLQHGLDVRGYRVKVAPDGNAALSYFSKQREKIDVLLTDIMLPGIHGLDLIPVVQGRSPGTKIIACSGQLSRGELVNSGVDFLQKPFTIEQLLEALDRVGARPSGEKRGVFEMAMQRSHEFPSGSSEATKRPATILIVDDEPAIMALLRDFLAKEGYVVRFAATGGEGHALLQKTRPDIVILDLAMPSVDGTEMLRRLKTQYPSGFPFAIIVLTGSAGDPRFQEVHSLGVTEIMHKPPDLLALRAIIQSHLQQRRA
jgi:CheY-like chemotaxis protein